MRQTQAGEPYALSVPVALTRGGRVGGERSPCSTSAQQADLDLPDGVVRVDLDPQFDVFRRLDLAETPPTLSELFGAEAVTLILPAAGSDPLADAWRGVRRRLAARAAAARSRW